MQEDQDPVTRLHAFFSQLRQRGLDPDIADAAERSAIATLRTTDSASIENLALQALRLHRRGANVTTVAPDSPPPAVSDLPNRSTELSETAEADRLIESYFGALRDDEARFPTPPYNPNELTEFAALVAQHFGE